MALHKWEPKAISTILIFNFVLNNHGKKRFMNIRGKESLKIATIMSLYVKFLYERKTNMFYLLGILH